VCVRGFNSPRYRVPELEPRNDTKKALCSCDFVVIPFNMRVCERNFVDSRVDVGVKGVCI